jgi:hypothetical protein
MKNSTCVGMNMGIDMGMRDICATAAAVDGA